MTDKIKERLYEISQSRHLYKIYFIIFLILFTLSFVLKPISVLFTNITICVFTILVLSYFFFKCFKKHKLKTIKKNKITTIILSDYNCTLLPLYILMIFVINLIDRIFNFPFIVELVLIVLLSITILILSTKISLHYNEKIIE